MASQLKLPVSIATKNDLIAVIRNLEVVLDSYIENNIRAVEGVDFQSRPDVSSNLAELVSANQLDVSEQTLKSLKSWLAQLKDHAPVVRFTFSSDPNPDFLGRIVLWLRDNSGQFVLVRYGIQPNIAAGCLMYTPARRYDFSLRKSLLESGEIFIKSLLKTAQALPAEQVPTQPSAEPTV